MPGLVRGVARTAVVAGTATAVSNRVSRRQAGRWADQEQQAAPPPPQYAAPPPQYATPPQYAAPQYAPPPQYAAPPPQYVEPAPVAPPPPAPPPQYVEPAPPPPAPVAEAPATDVDMSEKLAQLQQLGELKAQGILTEAEFEAQKSKILSA